ncbi:hypothetical protein ANANG_G00265060 [Anguilla anguilla]|uniref:Uncharacterized protein n=1 Tax=Anguilla anguilla TaxID=7936 RepID=A0A9D3LPI6_ANGAN|nr:hypothetical protein ANANG_G00265060 [Anguilla anguilla]
MNNLKRHVFSGPDQAHKLPVEGAGLTGLATGLATWTTDTVRLLWRLVPYATPSFPTGNAIQAFGYGPDVLPKASSLPARPTASAGLAPASTGKPPGNPPGNHPGNANEVSLSSDPCVFSTCANLKSDQGGHVESPFESRDSSKMEAEERERSSGVHLSSVQAGLVHLSLLWVRLAL